MADIFLSYAHADMARAEGIRDAFKAEGCDVFLDEHVGTGEEWPARLFSEIAQAAATVVLWSDASRDSEQVAVEAEEAHRLHTLMLLRIDAVDPPPFPELQYKDLIGWRPGERHPVFREIIAEVVTRAGAASQVAGIVRQAFHLRHEARYEMAADRLDLAFERFRTTVLRDEQRKDYRLADRYQKFALRALRAVSANRYNGRALDTLSSVAFLPIVDAVLDLNTEQVGKLLEGCCEMPSHLRAESRIRVGAVIRPAPTIDVDGLIERLDRERDSNALNLHCFLLVLNTRDQGRIRAFRAAAERSELKARGVGYPLGSDRRELGDTLDGVLHALCGDPAVHRTRTVTVAPPWYRR